MKAIIGLLLVSVVGCGTDFTSASNSDGGAGGSRAEGGQAGATPVDDAGSAGDIAAAGDAGSAGSSGGESDGGSGGTGTAGAAGAPVGMGGTGGVPSVAGAPGVAGAPSLPSVKAFDDFVASAEGWTITGDDVTKVPKYSSTGGNPNGQINATDGGTGVYFFTAPKKYQGDLSGFYGGELHYDIKLSVATPIFEYADIELTGGNGVTLAYDYPTNPGVAWKRISVVLSEKGWKVTTITGAAATAVQFLTVLKNVARLRIRGEFIDGNDTAYLDNVFLGAKGAQAPNEQ